MIMLRPQKIKRKKKKKERQLWQLLRYCPEEEKKKKKEKKKKRKKERWPAQTKKNKIKGRGNISPPPLPPKKKRQLEEVFSSIKKNFHLRLIFSLFLGENIKNLKRHFCQSRKISSSLNFLSILGRKHLGSTIYFLSSLLN